MNRTVLFNAVRRLLGRSFRQNEVDALDAAITAMAQSGTPVPPFSGLCGGRFWHCPSARFLKKRG